MPIYAFACNNCGHLFDKLQKLSDADPSACPSCGAEGRVHRQLTAPQFRLSGGGWYETDFKGANQSNAAKSETDSAASANSCSASSSSDSSSTNSSCASCPAAA